MKRSEILLLNLRCRFCLSSDHPTDQLGAVCDCPPPNNMAHLECLVRGLNVGLISPNCRHCYQPFRGVFVSVRRPRCRDWIRNDEQAKWDLLGSPAIIIYLLYVSLLGHLCYVTNYWNIFPLLRYFIVDMVNTIFYLSIAVTFVAIIKLFIDIEQWRRRNTEVVARPLLEVGAGISESKKINKQL